MQLTLNLTAIQPGTYGFFLIILTAYLCVSIIIARLVYTPSNNNKQENAIEALILGCVWPLGILIGAAYCLTILFTFIITTKNITRQNEKQPDNNSKYSKKEYYENNKLIKTEYHNKDGQLHNECGPAIEDAKGYKAWYTNGQLHNTNGPAIIYDDGYKSYYQNGQKDYDKTDEENRTNTKPKYPRK